MDYKRQLLRVSHNTFPGYEDPLQRQPQEHRPGLLFFLIWIIIIIIILKIIIIIHSDFNIWHV